MGQAIGIVSYEDEYYESAEINISKAQMLVLSLFSSFLLQESEFVQKI